MRTQKVAGNVVGEERIGLVIAGERKSARVDSCRLGTGRLALSSALSSASSSNAQWAGRLCCG